MKTIGSQRRASFKEAQSAFVKFTNVNQALIITSDGEFELWAMNDHYAGYVIEIDGVGYEFCKSISNAEVFKLFSK